MTLYCNVCAREQLHRISATVTKLVSETSNDDQGPFWYVSAQISECGGCGNFSFQEIFHDSDAPSEDDTSRNTYPERWYRLPRQYRAVPWVLESTYRELVFAYNQHWGPLPALSLLSTIGLSVLLEMICKDKGGTGADQRGRFGTVDSLEKLLPPNVVAALHEVRRLGNDAKHEFRHLDRENLGRALDAIESVLDTLYDLEAKAMNFHLQAPVRRRE